MKELERTLLRNVWHGLLLAVCSLACLPAYVRAGCPLPEDDTLRIQTVEVRANRRVTANRTVAWQELDREAVARQGITDLADALRRMAGTNVRDYGSAGGMKTLSVRSMGAAHTGVIYDGIAVTDCENGQIDLSRFDLDQVDRLTLVVGDNADIFVPARNLASSATLRLSSAAPRLEGRCCRSEVQLKTGSFGLLNPHLKWEQRLGGDWSLRLQGHYMQADNRYPFTLVNHTLVTEEKRANNKVRNGTGEADLYYTPASATRLHAKVYYYDSRKQLPGQVVYYNPVNHENQRFRNAFAQVHYTTRLATRLMLQANAKWNYAHTLYRDESYAGAGKIESNRYTQQEGYGSLALLYTPVQGLHIALSSDYAYTTLSSDAIDPRLPYRNTWLESLSLKYAHEQFTVTASVLASVYRHGAKEGKAASDAQRVSPSVALAWHPCAGRVVLRASYKDGFRMPTFNDNYYTWMGNRDLKPERASQFNVGGELRQVQGRGWLEESELRADVYYNKVKDKIVAMPMNMMFWNMVNLGKVDILGADLQGRVLLRPMRVLGVELNANYTYQHAVNVTEPGSKYYRHQIAYTPCHSGGASVAIVTPWLNVSVHGTAVSKRYSTNENMDITRLEPYKEFGLAAYRSFCWRGVGLTVRADVMNLANEQYDIVRLYPMPGRSWRLTLKLNI